MVAGMDDVGCNCYASGEHLYPEGILVEGWRNMLNWFDQLHASPDVEEPEFLIREEGVSAR